MTPIRTQRSQRNPALLSVVTGPAGVDIGPVAAWLGDTVGDGLAIRTVVSDSTAATLHASPIPAYVPEELRRLDGNGGSVLLAVLPSAWQNRDTNLGVAYSGEVDHRLVGDLDRLGMLGMHPGHRLTVQRHSDLRPTVSWSTDGGDHHVPEPVEIGDLATHARDSVWRGADTGAPRHVLVEAGDGQTLLEALHIVGIAPWTPSIDRLMLWVVVDMQRAVDTSPFLPLSPPGHPGAWKAAVDATADAARLEVLRNGGPVGPSMTVAITGLEKILSVAGFEGDLTTIPLAPDDILHDQIRQLCDAVSARAGADVLMMTTGVGTAITFD